MTEPGDATTVGAIVAYLRMNREEWNRDVDAAERDARRLGSTSPDIRIRSNAAETAAGLATVAAAERSVGDEANKSKPFVVNLWAALAAVAPAAVPIAAVAGGALIGLVPVLATVALGAKGISDEFKSGQLQAGRYGKDVAALGDEVSRLKDIAANGLLSGLDRGLAASQGLFGEVNQDVAVMSTQLGDIVAGGMPALLHLLTALNPLFVTFGQAITHGATNLERWSKSSDGVNSFVAYVQAELPHVIQFLGEVVTLFSHLAQGAAPFGGVILTDITLLVHALNSIPVEVLRTAIPLAVALYLALKVYSGVNAIIASVNRSIESMQPRLAASAASAEASSLATQAAVAEEAATVARAKAAEAAATAESAVSIAASVEGTTSVLAAGATAAAESAIEFAAAMEAEAEAATVAAVTISESAAAAAEASATAGEAAAVGWAGMLGPLAAVGVGVALLATVFFSTTGAETEAAKATNTYTQALIASKGAIDNSVRAKVASTLADEGLLKAAATAGVSVSDLTDAVIGNEEALRRVKSRLNDVAGALGDNGDGTSDLTGKADKLNHAVVKLTDAVGDQRTSFDKATESARLQLKAMQDNASAADHGAAQAAKLYGLVGRDGVDAYLAATQAAQKSTDQSKAQTLQWQLENDAGQLLAQTIDQLSGKNLSYAQAQNAFEQQLQAPAGSGGGSPVDTSGLTNRRATAVEALAVAQRKYDAALKDGTPAQIASAHLALSRAQDALARATNALTDAQNKNAASGQKASIAVKGHSAEAVAERGRIISLVSAAEQSAAKYGDMTGSSEKARLKLIELRKTLIDNEVGLGANRKQVTAFVDSILKIPAKVPPTKLDVQKTEAEKKIADIQARINRIKQGKEPYLKANDIDARTVIAGLQRQIDRIRGKKVPIDAIDNVTPVLRVIKGHLDEIHNKKVVISTIVTGPGGFSTKGSQGETIYGQAAGGPVTGSGAKGVDSVLRMLAPGEFVMSDKAVDRFGLPFMRALNAGQAPQLQAAAPRATAVASSAPAPAAGLNAGNIAQALHGMHLVIDAGSLGTLTGFVDSRVDGTLGRAARTSTARQSRVEAFGRT